MAKICDIISQESARKTIMLILSFTSWCRDLLSVTVFTSQNVIEFTLAIQAVGLCAFASTPKKMNPKAVACDFNLD